MKQLSALFLCTVLLLNLSGCGSSEPPQGGDTLTLVATTYPVYCFVTAVTDGVEGVSVSRLIDQQVSCLHDYTLTVRDMKLLERADVLILNGAGLEDFLSDALDASSAQVIDCSTGVALLPSREEDGHDPEAEYDPHIWMDPRRAAQMAQNICDGLSALDGAHAAQYQENTRTAVEQLNEFYTAWADEVRALAQPELITFHDGFSYFADAFGLELLRAIEEEEGSEASAKELAEVVSLVEAYRLPAIFTEVNGSDSSAQAIARETGVQVRALSMVMSGEGSGLAPYLSAQEQNLTTLLDALEVTAP
jgi:ABC-type Zn uptake system ZnuABC Zn-binding protein ZnuA